MVTKGFSTIEMLVAMTVMLLVLSAALLLSFVGKSVTAGRPVSAVQRALSLAERDALVAEEVLAT